MCFNDMPRKEMRWKDLLPRFQRVVLAVESTRLYIAPPNLRWH
jgi:hypothetical protein